MNDDANDNRGLAERMAEALARGGIQSDRQKNEPNLKTAIEDAYRIQSASASTEGFENLRRAAKSREIGAGELLRELISVCQGALSDQDLNEGLVERIAYAWGYYSAILIERSAEAEVRELKRERVHLPLAAAFNAFHVCTGESRREWNELREDLGANHPGVPYFRKMAELCFRALRRPFLSEDLREPIAFAWGHYRSQLELHINPRGCG